jgi:hypothetical protein
VWSHQAVAGGGFSTTLVTAKDTLVDSTQIDNSIIPLTGTGSGQLARRVTANTGSGMTTLAFPTAFDASTTFEISNNPGYFGAWDFNNVGASHGVATLGKGLQVAVVGAPAAGSNVRVRARGYIHTV